MERMCPVFISQENQFTFSDNCVMVSTSGSGSFCCLMKRETGENPVRTRHCERVVQRHICH